MSKTIREWTDKNGVRRRTRVVLRAAIALDNLQVKGAHKSDAKNRIGTDTTHAVNGYLGIMKAWDRRAGLAGCFELLENVQVNKHTVRAVNSLVDEAMEKLAKDGVDGLLARISRDDPNLDLIIKLLAKAVKEKCPINPRSIPMLARALDDKLQRALWHIAQGAAITGQQFVVVMDEAVPEGKVVLPGYRVGQNLCIWRFPLVLEQGLVQCEVVPPPPHMLVRGRLPQNTIYMNPLDVVDKMQGDDDGDIVGVSADPRVKVLFDNKLTNRVWMIEPDGQKFTTGSTTVDGLKYLRGTPMGPVGTLTIHRSKLLAVGDYYGALACSVAIQEAIDSAKRSVRWSCWLRASNTENWQCINRRYYLHWVKLKSGSTDPSAPCPLPRTAPSSPKVTITRSSRSATTSGTKPVPHRERGTAAGAIQRVGEATSQCQWLHREREGQAEPAGLASPVRVDRGRRRAGADPTLQADLRKRVEEQPVQPARLSGWKPGAPLPRPGIPQLG